MIVRIAPIAPPAIVVNGRYLTRRFTGTERVTHELITALMDLRGDSEPVDVLVPKTVKLLGLDDGGLPPNTRLIRTGRLKGHYWEQLELPRVVRDRWLLSLCNTGPLRSQRQVVMIHDAQTYDAPRGYSFKFRALYKQLQPRLARSAAILLTVSSYSRQRLEYHGVAPPNKAVVIYNGVDHIARFSADPSALSRFALDPLGYLLAVGSLSPNKNLDLLLRAASDRPGAALPLVIAGGGNSRTFAVAGFNVAQSNQFLGRVSEGELKALYCGAYAFVFPSLSEGFGLPPLEAMLCGCPVIATTGGAVPEVCGDAALYVDPSDQRGWTNAMITLASDPLLRLNLAQRGISHAGRFTWNSAARQLSSLLS